MTWSKQARWLKVSSVIYNISLKFAAFRKINPFYSSVKHQLLISRKAAMCFSVTDLLGMTSHTFVLLGFICVVWFSFSCHLGLFSSVCRLVLASGIFMFLGCECMTGGIWLVVSKHHNIPQHSYHSCGAVGQGISLTSQQACGAVTQGSIAMLSLCPQSSLSRPHQRETLLSPSCCGWFGLYECGKGKITERYGCVGGWLGSFMCFHIYVQWDLFFF